MQRINDLDLACQLQAKTLNPAGGFGLECNRAIHTAAKTAAEEKSDNFTGQVVPAGKGTGKTTFTLSLIAALVHNIPACTAAFVTPTIDAAQSAYDDLCKMLPKEVVTVHSSAYTSASEAAKRGQ